MIIVLSPAKSLDFQTPPTLAEHSQPRFLDDSQELIDELRELSPAQLASLMKISDPLAVLNVTRYAEWARPFTPATPNRRSWLSMAMSTTGSTRGRWSR
jgi:cytoplasmic iron level regulating protein YaaA (DUF328/UPF0246 family)